MLAVLVWLYLPLWTIMFGVISLIIFTNQNIQKNNWICVFQIVLNTFFFFFWAASCLQAVRASCFIRTGAAGFTVFGSFFTTLPTSCFSVRQVFFANRYTWITHQQVQRLVTYMDLAFVLILFMRQASSSDLSFWFFCRVETTSLSKPFFDAGVHHLCAARHFR